MIISPTPIHRQQPEPLIQSRMLFMVNSDSTIQMSLHNLRLVQFWWASIFLFWQERHPVWSSAALAHLLQGLRCCVFRNGLLHTNGYLSYFCLPVGSKLPHHSPLTSTRYRIGVPSKVQNDCKVTWIVQVTWTSLCFLHCAGYCLTSNYTGWGVSRL